MRRSGLVMGIILLAKSIEEGPGDDAKGYTDDKQVFHTRKGRPLWEELPFTGNLSVQRATAAGGRTEAREKGQCLRSKAEEPQWMLSYYIIERATLKVR